jgi:hypothetical protein
MNTRVLLAGLAAGVVAFLLGWVLFGMLLMDYFTANMHQYPGLMKTEAEMSLPLIFLGNLAYAMMLAWLCARTAQRGALPGLVTGAVVGLGVYLSITLMFFAFMHWYQGPAVAVVDVLANTLWSALVGMVAGAVLGRKKA